MLAIFDASTVAAGGMAIERYADARPAEVAPLIRKFDQILLQRGATIGGGLLWADFHRLPAIVDKALTVEELTDALEGAYKEWRRTEFATAEPHLETALRLVAENPGIATRIRGLADLLTKAYVTLALIRLDHGNKQGALDLMMRLVRDIPYHPAVRAQFGPDAENLYNDALKATQHNVKLGALHVSVSDADAHIFIDEIERGKDGVFEGALPEGDYRIYVRVGSTGYRFDRHVFSADEVSTDIHIDWKYELALVATPEWVGLIIPSEMKAHELAFMSQVSRTRSTQLMVVGFRKSSRHRYLTGEVYDDRLQSFIRSGEILLDDPREDERMRAFAAFLDDGTTSPLVTIGIGKSAEDPVIRVTASDGVPALTVAGWIVGGGIAVTGSGLIAADYDGSCSDRLCKAKYGWPMVFIGVGMIVSGMLWSSHVDRKTTQPMISVSPGVSGATASVGWRF